MTFQIGDPGHVDEHNRQRDVEQVPTAALKYHRVSPLVLPDADVWVPVEFEDAPADEQLPGLSLDADNITIVSEVRDLMWVSGCVRPNWTGPDNTSAVVATRIVTSAAPGEPFVENRCLQAIQGRERQTGEAGTFHYMGTIGCEVGTRFRLEVQVDDVRLELQGSDIFDSPVSVSLQAHGMGRAAFPS